MFELLLLLFLLIFALFCLAFFLCEEEEASRLRLLLLFKQEEIEGEGEEEEVEERGGEGEGAREEEEDEKEEGADEAACFILLLHSFISSCILFNSSSSVATFCRAYKAFKLLLKSSLFDIFLHVTINQHKQTRIHILK